MVVSHRESSISSNIRAIIEQLNLNPVERRRLIDKTRQNGNTRCKSFPDGIVVESQAPKISIGVYGCKDRSAEYEIPSPIGKTVIAARKIEIERSRPKAETRQRLSTQKEAHIVCQVKKEAPAVPVKRESRVERANEVKTDGIDGDRIRLLDYSLPRSRDNRYLLPPMIYSKFNIQVEIYFLIYLIRMMK